MEDAVIPNDKNNDDGSLASLIDPFQTIFQKLKEWTEWAMKMKKRKLKELILKLEEWNQKMKEWTTYPYPLIKKGIS